MAKGKTKTTRRETAAHRDILDHPDFMERLRAQRGGLAWSVQAMAPIPDNRCRT